jgi:hypothetical protein
MHISTRMHHLHDFFLQRRIASLNMRYMGARNQCCGSESEIIGMFWLDPNPKKVWIRIQSLL